jgi:hypothetical protein
VTISGGDPESVEGREEPASGVLVGVDRAHACVDEDHPVVGPDEEPAEVEVQRAVLVQGVRVAGPGVRDAGTGQDLRRPLLPDAVEHGEDLDRSDLHAAPVARRRRP